MATLEAEDWQKLDKMSSAGGFMIACGTDAELAQVVVLLEAAQVYSKRNVKYKDNWKRMGWRGCLVRVRERSERLWDNLWTKKDVYEDDLDDALDMINFLGFLVRGARGESTADGEWGWRS